MLPDRGDTDIVLTSSRSLSKELVLGGVPYFSAEPGEAEYFLGIPLCGDGEWLLR